MQSHSKIWSIYNLNYIVVLYGTLTGFKTDLLHYNNIKNWVCLEREHKE